MTTTDTTTSESEEEMLDVKTLYESDPGSKRVRFTFRTPNAEIVFTYGDREEGVHLAANFVDLVVQAASLADRDVETPVEPFDINFATNDEDFVDAANQ